MDNNMDNNMIFAMVNGNQQVNLFNLPEQPNHKIEVKILLQRNFSATVLRELQSNLQQNDMQVVSGGSSEITVRGTPPDNGFGAQRVLEAVRKYDNGAKIISKKDFK